MKQYLRSIALTAFVVTGLATLYQTAQAQQFAVQPLWGNYSVVYVPRTFYNALVGGTVLPGLINQNDPNSYVDFLNFAGAVDYDDGTAANIPTGFTFDYNGTSSNSVNININGWITIRSTDPNAVWNQVPVTPANNGNLFNSNLPNNTAAPYWGDHRYYPQGHVPPGYSVAQISFRTDSSIDPNKNKNSAFARIHVFTVEWRNLNINNKANPNSIASFQLIIRQNPLANDKSAPDQRATIEFQYGPEGSNGSVQTQGAAVGAEDDSGFTHVNALFTTAGDPFDVANDTTTRTSTWPPSGNPGVAIDLVPVGRSVFSNWGDGDVFLRQVNDSSPIVRNNQSMFVTVADAMAILQASATASPLDSIEGHAAFHGDANHNGRVYNTFYGAYFYHTTPYDAAYILMYLAGKLSALPWPLPLPVPGYKESDIHSTNVSGIAADVSNISTIGNTVLLPIVVKGNVNGPLSIQMDLKGLDISGAEFVGTRCPEGTLMSSDAATGRVTLATAGEMSDGQTLGYLELTARQGSETNFDFTNVVVNDMDMPSSHIAFKLGDGTQTGMNDLEQNSPNPFNVSVAGTTTIGFDLAQSENVTLRVYDMLGHEIRTLIADEGRAAGHNSIQWDGRDGSGNYVANGMYYYQLVTPDFTQCVKMQVVH